MKTKRPRIRIRKVATVFKSHSCTGGPWDKSTVWLDAYCDGNTGWLNIGGRVGRYCNGKWEPMADPVVAFLADHPEIAYANRVAQLESEGLTTSDAQACADAEELRVAA